MKGIDLNEDVTVALYCCNSTPFLTIRPAPEGGILKYFDRCVACSGNAIQFMKQFFFASNFRNNFIEKKVLF